MKNIMLCVAIGTVVGSVLASTTKELPFTVRVPEKSTNDSNPVRVTTMDRKGQTPVDVLALGIFQNCG